MGARAHTTLTGALDRGRLGLGDRLIARAVKAPDGDFRDWQAIRAWAHAVRRAEREGSVGVFVEAGPACAKLLGDLGHPHDVPPYGLGATRVVRRPR